MSTPVSQPWFGRRGGYGIALVLLIAACALVFRCQQLERRPFHSDEAVQAVKAGELYDRGQYLYNPHEFHGPSLYYFTLPVLKLSGAKASPMPAMPASAWCPCFSERA